jgi:hypothetical protein
VLCLNSFHIFVSVNACIVPQLHECMRVDVLQA